jgi:hypothetical protein
MNTFIQSLLVKSNPDFNHDKIRVQYIHYLVRVITSYHAASSQ